MRIAVLFGSFNPLTSSHLSIMKSAVEQLNADKLFIVATNGKYLKRKTVKINDPFYLTEEERKEMIEKACMNEDKLSFYGFELGGVSPKRYKTICAIRKKYPNAEIVEIQGADKVRSISKFGDAEEYVANTRFAIFGRNGIDLDALIVSDELLCAHKDAFILLPALEEGAEISSTEVRRRFYAGMDYSDLVPEETLEVMNRHKPTDFSVSFAERMETIVKSGRFGVNAAQKEVYAENIKLFKAWRDGATEMDFGDYQEFLDNTKLYTKPFDVKDCGAIYESTETGCINIDCVDLAEHLIKKGYKPAILNLASAKNPGGGVDQGLSAQEESLCRSSNLSVSLYQYGDPQYKKIRESGVPTRFVGYPWDMNYGGIYTPNVTFFRHGKAKFYALRENVFKCDVISVAALSFNGRSDYSGVNELSFRSETGGFTPAGEEIMLNKIRLIFRMGIEHGNDVLCAGAFGNGAYKLPVPDVVRLFRRVMEEAEFKNKYRMIVFAILESMRKPNGENGKFAEYYHEFGKYRLED